jgi:hypothetical protein
VQKLTLILFTVNSFHRQQTLSLPYDTNTKQLVDKRSSD